MGLEGFEMGLKGMDALIPENMKKDGMGAKLDKLASVDWDAAVRNEGLKGDWFGLWKTWLFEEKPSSLGKWDKVQEKDEQTPWLREEVRVLFRRAMRIEQSEGSLSADVSGKIYSPVMP